jgi:hypothetical protein
MKRTTNKRLELKPEMVRVLGRTLSAKELKNAVGGAPTDSEHSMVAECLTTHSGDGCC